MRFERPSTDDDAENVESLYGEPRHETGGTDERALYGEPHHESERAFDEQSLYGDPQHETGENRQLPDIELLFARMRADSAPGPAVLQSRTESSAGETLEQ